MLRIAVCIKQIIDPELPASKFTIDPVIKTQKPDGLNLVISSFDENALEVALRLKDKDPKNTTVTVFTVGEQSALTALKKALSRGADEAILINDPILHYAPPTYIAMALTCAIKKLPPYNLILSGCVSGDWSDGVIGGFIAEILDMRFLACANVIEKEDNDMLRITRLGEVGTEIWKSPPPLSVSIISSATNAPRYEKLKDIMAANKKSISVWSASDIGFDPNTAPHSAEKKEVRIASRETNCEMVPEGEPSEQAALLLAKLRERRAL